MEYHPLYVRGVELFNAREFYEAHDVWEELWQDWRGPESQFFKGLIQTAVALFHFGNRNIHGARKLYRSSSGYLAPYAPAYLGLDVDTFLSQFERCFADVLASDEARPAVKLDADLIPEIELARQGDTP